ncbi:MAG: FHA domain-containing protein [bacterium]
MNTNNSVNFFSTNNLYKLPEKQLSQVAIKTTELENDKFELSTASKQPENKKNNNLLMYATILSTAAATILGAIVLHKNGLLAEVKTQLSSKETHLNEINQKVKETLKNSQALENELAKLKEQALKSADEALNKTVETLQKEKQALETKAQLLEQQLKQAKNSNTAEVSELKQQLNILNTEKQKLEQNVRNLVAESKSKDGIINSLQQDISQIKTASDEATKKLADLQKSALEAADQKLNKAVEILQKEKQALEEKANTLEQQLQQAKNSNTAEVSELNKQLNSLKTEKQKLEQNVNKLVTETKSKDGIISSLQQKIEQIKTESNEATQKLVKINQAALEASDKNLQKAVTDLKTQKAEIDKLNKELEDSLRTQSSNSAEITNLKAKVKELENKNIELNKNIGKVENEIISGIQSKLSKVEHPAVGKQVKINLEKDGEFFIGREASPSCIEITDSGKVSRTHLKLNIKNGKVEITDVSANGTLLNGNIIQKNKPITINKLDEIQIDNTIYLFDGKELKTLTNDAETYREMFNSGIKDLPFYQGQNGNCYALSGFDSLRAMPDAKCYLANMISKEKNGDIIVNFAGVKEGAGKKIIIKAAELPSILNDPEAVISSNGLKIIERAYGHLIKAERQSLNPNSNKTMFLMSGGRPGDFMEAIVPGIKHLIFWGNDIGDMSREAEHLPYALNMLKSFSANKERMALTAATRRGAAGGHEVILKTIGNLQIAQTHAYSIKNVDLANQKILLANPWDSSEKAYIAFDEFFKLFGTIDSIAMKK